MKRSPCISLVLLSTLSLTACDSDVPGTRNEYLTLQDCVQDWGDATECEESGGRFFGPAVFYDDDDHKHYYKSKKHGSFTPTTAKPVYTKALAGSHSKAVAHSSVRVGGFGSSGGFHGVSS